jgi:hypothetical protein
MRHFLQIATGVDVVPALNALAVQDDLWNENSLRSAYPNSPHAEVDDVWLLFNRMPANPAEVIDDIQAQAYRGWWALPQLRLLVLDLARRVEGISLGRVIVTRLRPGGRIAPHVDQGAPAEVFTRYQIALQSLPGAVFRVEDEEVSFRTGDVWKINNRAEHSVINNSADDRIVCIVDVRIPTC